MRSGYRVSSFVTTEKNYQIFLIIAREFYENGLIDKPSVGLLAKYSTIYMANKYQEAITKIRIKRKEEARKKNLKDLQDGEILKDQLKGGQTLPSSSQQKEARLEEEE
ncbi:MAG TPA: hypothetical protein VIP70_02525 [Nitrososphaeraceae archaeon]